MVTKVVVCAGLALLCASTTTADQAAKYSATQYFKNYALSTCIANGYTAEETVKDASAAARGYLEFGDFPMEAHTEAVLLGREFLKRAYKSKTGEPLVLMKCVDFYHSAELDGIASRYRRTK